jgi:hypothetical protein
MKTSLFKGLSRKAPARRRAVEACEGSINRGFAYVGICYLRVPVHQDPRFYGHYY